MISAIISESDPKVITVLTKVLFHHKDQYHRHYPHKHYPDLSYISIFVEKGRVFEPYTTVVIHERWVLEQSCPILLSKRDITTAPWFTDIHDDVTQIEFWNSILKGVLVRLPNNLLC